MLCSWLIKIHHKIYQQKMDGQLSVQNIYSLVTHKIEGAKGVDGYHVDKKYFDCAKAMKQREAGPIKKGQKDRRHVTKRGNYLEDEQKLHQAVPGVGKYKLQQEWPEKSKLKLHYPDKATYVDQIMKHEKREKKPAPGQYNVVKTQKEIQTEKKKMKQKKVPFQERISYLDQVQYEANQLPGVGNYNPRMRVHTEGSKLKTTPEEWRKKHEKESKKKPQKSPEPASYNPKPSTYQLFENKQKVKSNRALMGKVQRFKTAPGGSGLNPAKYNVIQEWKGKDTGKILRHGVEVLSTKKTAKSVYYH